MNGVCQFPGCGLDAPDSAYCAECSRHCRGTAPVYRPSVFEIFVVITLGVLWKAVEPVFLASHRLVRGCARRVGAVKP